MGDVRVVTDLVRTSNAATESEDPANTAEETGELSPAPGDTYVAEDNCRWICVDRPLWGPLCYCKPISNK